MLKDKSDLWYVHPNTNEK